MTQATLERKAPARAAAKPKPSARPRKAELSSGHDEYEATVFVHFMEGGRPREPQPVQPPEDDTRPYTYDEALAVFNAPESERPPLRGLVAVLDKIAKKCKFPPDFDWKEDYAQALEEKYFGRPATEADRPPRGGLADKLAKRVIKHFPDFNLKDDVEPAEEDHADIR